MVDGIDRAARWILTRDGVLLNCKHIVRIRLEHLDAPEPPCWLIGVDSVDGMPTDIYMSDDEPHARGLLEKLVGWLGSGKRGVFDVAMYE